MGDIFDPTFIDCWLAAGIIAMAVAVYFNRHALWPRKSEEE